MGKILKILVFSILLLFFAASCSKDPDKKPEMWYDDIDAYFDPYGLKNYNKKKSETNSRNKYKVNNIKESNNGKCFWENDEQKAVLLKDPKLHQRIKDCILDTNMLVMITYLTAYPENYSDIKALGDINGDGTEDSILVIPEIYVDEGSYDEAASIIFTDPIIPRIRVDAPCLDVDYIFPVGDIDEDGNIELGKYYSSCASRFKGLQLISLRNGEWKKIASVIFDIFYELPPKEDRIKIVEKNKFAMREISHNDSGEYDIWVEFSMDSTNQWPDYY